MAREKLGSRLGFILLSAGCAIGLGNVWRFPYIVGKYGGAAFVLVYLFFLVSLGLPIMVMEYAVGRASQRSAATSFDVLEPKGSKWHIAKVISVLGNYLLMMFYTMVAGWMLYYAYMSASGKLSGLDAVAIKGEYENMLASPGSMTLFMLIAVVLSFGICALGLKNGVEKITKIMMCILIVLMIVLAINSVTLDGAKEGVEFYLKPNFSEMKRIGMGSVVFAALTHAFFTLSIGMGSMEIFGSYLKKDRTLLGESINILCVDTFVALTAGLIIIPACFAYGIEPDAGPSLLFITLPNVFNHMPAGRFWGTAFFVFMSFAALSTVLAVFENIISCTMDVTGWGRKKTCIVNAIAMMVLVLPCIFGYSIWSGFHPLGGTSTVLDLEDFIVSNILLPLGTLTYVVYSTVKYGWGWDKFMEEANAGKGLKVKKWMRPYMTFVLPVMILVLFIFSVIDVFV